MGNRKLNYIFHNPNSADVAADNILKVFMEVNQEKVAETIRKMSCSDGDIPKKKHLGH